MQFEFLAPPRIVFGWGRRSELGTLASSLGRRAFVVLGSRTLLHNNRWKELAGNLGKAGLETILAALIDHEPEVQDVDHLAWQLSEHDAGPGDLLVAIGGGSAIDLAKAAAGLATNHESTTIRDYLEGVGQGLGLREQPLPVLAMPTTGGTGTEVTKNAVITSYDPPFKKSFRHAWLIPRIVLVDPELTVSVPPSTTIATGMDAITQLMESYLSRFANPMTQTLCVDGLRRALPALPEAVQHPDSRSARESLSYAALLSGLALANSGLGYAHGVAAALGCIGKVTHGLACAVMLPRALVLNRDIALASLGELSRRIWPDAPTADTAASDQLIQYIQDLNSRFQLPSRLSELGISADHLEKMIPLTRGNSMAGNPRDLSDDEILTSLKEML